MDIRIGNATLTVEGVRQLKNDVKLDDALKNSLAKDGFDEIIFQKGDDLFIAYQKNMKLDGLNLNLDSKAFSVDMAYDAGQLSVNGDAVQVLHVDDENKDSFWIAPYKTAASGVKSLINHPFGKAGMLGFVGGLATTIAGKNLNIATDYNGVAKNLTHFRTFNSILIGTAAGGVIGGLKAGAEHDEPEFWDTGAGVGSAAIGFGLGAGAGALGDELVKTIGQNPRVAAMAAGIATLVVGTGIALDALSDNAKPATYRVINSISEKNGDEVSR